MATRKKQISTVDSWSEVPQFATEAEEAEWWSAHEPGDRLLTQMKPVALTPEEQTARGARTHPVAIRFDDSTLQRVRALAHRRHKGYQTLLKEFVVERLYEEEKREGMVG
jgi:CopG antitoxin of type II toxin-antitoxin system